MFLIVAIVALKNHWIFGMKPKYHHHSNKNNNQQGKILFKGSCQESGLRFDGKKSFSVKETVPSCRSTYNNDTTICFLRKLSDRWPPFSNHFRCRRRSSIQKPSSGRTHVKSRVWEPLDYFCVLLGKNQTFSFQWFLQSFFLSTKL